MRVRERQGLVERIDRVDGRERREELVAEEAMVRRQMAHDRGLDVEAPSEVAVAEGLAAGEDGAVRARLGDGLLVPVDGGLVGQRSQPVLAHERVADGDALGLLDEQAHQLIVDRLARRRRGCWPSTSGRRSRRPSA